MDNKQAFHESHFKNKRSKNSNNLIIFYDFMRQLEKKKK